MRAREALSRNGYVGPAPVTLQAYVGRVRAQSLGDMQISMDQLRKALSHLVLPEYTLRQLGPAINSGRSIFLFGPPGTGKSSIANALSGLMQGGMVLPYAILVGQQVIRVYDVSRHHALVALDARFDRRWVPVSRPFVEVGGELTLEDLDFVVDDATKVHEAPFQMKASGGILLIDDFGRQRVKPDDLLNRWIVPLDRDVDFLTTADGRKIEVPFDVLLVFATFMDFSTVFFLQYVAWTVPFLDTVVTFTLAPTPSGTRLSLAQSGFKPEQKQEFGGARYGWKMMGERLVELLARMS